MVLCSLSPAHYKCPSRSVLGAYVRCCGGVLCSRLPCHGIVNSLHPLLGSACACLAGYSFLLCRRGGRRQRSSG